ncbi:MAG: STAS domain-containing protein [Chromatiales bacterium]|jgi:phospholipid transport system transporter-binding protein|nr:STAS domain-containing protein [Chromatiales bacterium]
MSDVRFEDLGDGKFALHGKLTFTTATRALEMSKDLFADHARIEVDMTNVEDGDSAGLALLLEWVNWAKNFVREIRYINIPPQIVAIAQISEVDDMLTKGERWTGII